mmetsp:Transcript_16218/g.30268  ORF Transcript_16218/g.30268 Transcript_16218/m.30268 type:complete len:412 (+) Transcript_16218:56-1291(+)
MARDGDFIEVLARSLSGVAVFGPRLLPRATAVADLRVELLQQRMPNTGVLRIVLQYDGEFVEDCYTPHGDVFECTMLLRREHLPEEERCRCVKSLSQAKWGHHLPYRRHPPWMLRYYPEEKEAGNVAVAECFSSFSDVARADTDLVTRALGFSWRALEFADPRLQARKKIVQKAIQENGLAIQFASSELRQDRKLMLQAIHHNPRAIAFASPNLLKDRTFLIDAVAVNEFAKGYVPLSFVDEELLTSWIDDSSEVPNHIDHAEASRKVRLDGMWLASAEALRCANYADIQSDRDIALAAVGQNPEALQYTRFTDDYEVVLVAVCGNGKVLEFASVELRRNHTIVCAAISSNPRARRFAIDKPLFDVSELDAEIEVASTEASASGSASHRRCRRRVQCAGNTACRKQKRPRS